MNRWSVRWTPFKAFFAKRLTARCRRAGFRCPVTPPLLLPLLVLGTHLLPRRGLWVWTSVDPPFHSQEELPPSPEELMSGGAYRTSPCVGGVMAYRSRYSWRGGDIAVTLSLVLQAVTAAGASVASIRQSATPFSWAISTDNLTIAAP